MLSVKYKCFNIGWPQGNTYWCIQSNSKIKQSAVICVFVRACEKKCMWVFMLCKSMPYCFNPFNILNNIPCIILLNYYLECLYKFPYTGDSTCFSISFRNTYCNWLTLSVTCLYFHVPDDVHCACMFAWLWCHGHHYLLFRCLVKCIDLTSG